HPHILHAPRISFCPQSHLLPSPTPLRSPTFPLAPSRSDPRAATAAPSPTHARTASYPRTTQPATTHKPDKTQCVRGSGMGRPSLDRKSTRLNSSHVSISYAGFCLKKKTT